MSSWKLQLSFETGALRGSIHMSIKHIDYVDSILPEERHEMIQKGEESLK